jgi:hypothetical protein
MPSIKNNINKHFTHEDKNIVDKEEEKRITLENYLNNKESNRQLLCNHYNTFSEKYEERIKEIYSKYYHKYNYFGFLEKDSMGYYDIYNIILKHIEIKYDLDIFEDNT